jgi:hypothetical protein
MGGLLGSAKQFTAFRHALDQIRLDYDFDIFHAVEMKGGKGDFQAWPYEKQLALVIDFDRLISTTITAAIASRIDKNDHKIHYLDDLQFPDVLKDSAYGLCFRMSLVAFLDRIEKTYRYHHEAYVVNVTVEQGDPNWKDAKRIFEETKALVPVCFAADPLGTFRTATKQECPELMVADFLAYSDYMIRTKNLGDSAVSEQDLAEFGLPVPQPGTDQDKLIRVSFEPECLRQLSAYLAELHRKLDETKHMGK